MTHKTVENIQCCSAGYKPIFNESRL